MGKTSYHFNRQTLTYEEVRYSTGQKIWAVLKQLSIGIGIGVVLFIFAVYVMDSPREQQLKKENKLLLAQYGVLSHRIDEYQKVLDDLQERDDQLYRATFNADPIPTSIRRPGFGGTDRYEHLSDISNSKTVIATTQKLDIMAKAMYVQSNSYDELIKLIKQKEQRMNNIPAIRPLSGKDMKGMSSGFGMRVHPIFGDLRMHTGIDLNADAGSPIYATGNGTVESSGWEGGYGNCVVINHGFGFKSLYGHCKELLVNPGAKVKRGQKIATVGMTGVASGNHVHYEVQVKGKYDNPAKYFFMDLSPEEYSEMLYLTEHR
ncbi:MAG: M23 family metallopeptidase [Dysgonamonadaceae bacterium]|jgi:murein DD-endopeptidase MepM/ murein hydrolase activator NlpD|nr:M23 family metallopeptidase [Dysgonamonadaceae bacterium]